MQRLIKNNTQTPFYFPFNHSTNGSKGAAGRITLEPGQVQGVEESLFEKVLSNNAFFHDRCQKGDLDLLDGGILTAEAARRASKNSNEAAYTRFLWLMNEVNHNGGLGNRSLAPHLEADGTPKLDLIRKNMGSNVEPQIIEQFKSRYLIEKKNGLHQQSLVLPGGMRPEPVTTAEEQEAAPEASKTEAAKAPVVHTNEELSAMDIAELHALADELGVKYGTSATVELLIKKIAKVEAANAE